VAKVVRSHLKVLVAEHEMNNKRRLGIRTIATEAGVSVSTVQGLMNNTMKRVPLDDLGRLCAYLGVEVGDILKFEEVPDA
jgi:putative transcriptional regulator